MSHQATDNQVDTQRAASDALARTIERQRLAVANLRSHVEATSQAYQEAFSESQSHGLLLAEFRAVLAELDGDEAAAGMRQAISQFEAHVEQRRLATEAAKAEYESHAAILAQFADVLARLERRAAGVAEARETAPSISSIGARL